MYRRTLPPTALFWHQFGFAIVVLSIGVSWNVSKTKVLELEVAEYKVKTNSALSKVKKVSHTLEKCAEYLPMTNEERIKIEQDLKQSNKVIEEVGSIVDAEVKSLTKPHEH